MFKIYRYEENEALNDDDLEDFDVPEKSENPYKIGDFETEEEPVENLEISTDEEEEEKDEDPQFAGTIRTVVGAALVYKRREKSNSYEELWIYNSDNDLKTMTKIRNSILAGTDIDPHTERSEDGKQTCDTTTIGNVQFLHIRGLPN